MKQMKKWKKVYNMNKKTLINIVIIVLVLLTQGCRNQDNTKTEINLTTFEKGLKYFNDKQYNEAKEIFGYVQADDSNYSTVKEYMKICNNKLHFENGLKFYNENKFLDARNEFGNISQDDSNYTKVLEYIKICDMGADEELKERKRLEQKYRKFFIGNGWLHEKQTKLMNLGFKQYKSGYEVSPDGSQQIAMYYKKVDSGYIINVMLQYSYSMEHHYAKVWVE